MQSEHWEKEMRLLAQPALTTSDGWRPRLCSFPVEARGFHRGEEAGTGWWRRGSRAVLLPAPPGRAIGESQSFLKLV